MIDIYVQTKVITLSRHAMYRTVAKNEKRVVLQSHKISFFVLMQQNETLYICEKSYCNLDNTCKAVIMTHFSLQP